PCPLPARRRHPRPAGRGRRPGARRARRVHRRGGGAAGARRGRRRHRRLGAAGRQPPGAGRRALRRRRPPLGRAGGVGRPRDARARPAARPRHAAGRGHGCRAGRAGRRGRGPRPARDGHLRGRRGGGRPLTGARAAGGAPPPAGRPRGVSVSSRVTDRFHDPERPRGDPRRVFIPAPSTPPGRGGPGGSVAPPRPRRAPAPPPGRPSGPPPSRPRPPGGPPRPPGRGRTGPWYRRVRWRRVLLVTGLVLVAALVGGYLYARSIFNRIERVDVGDSLTSASHGTNYLIVGSDSRANVTGEGDAGFNGADAPGGQRADTIMVLHLEGGRAQMLSI